MRRVRGARCPSAMQVVLELVVRASGRYPGGNPTDWSTLLTGGVSHAYTKEQFAHVVAAAA
jgi:hypothetical protein